MVFLASMQASSAAACTRQVCDGDSAAAEGAYRLLRNDHIQPDAIAEGAFQSVAEEASTRPLLVAAEDTTTLTVSKALKMELGDVGGPAAAAVQGLFVHSVLLVDPQSKETIGLIEQQRWARDPATRGKRHDRRTRAYEDKESFKWQSASERMATRLGETMSRVISACDREADIYEYLLYKQARGERFVVRCSWDRGLADSDVRLREQVASWRVIGSSEVEVAQRGGKHGRSARKARVVLRAGKLSLRAPLRLDKKGAPIPLSVVDVREEDAPDGVEPLHWTLLSSEAVSNPAEAAQILDYYRLRWRIEEFHKAWKTGCGAEMRRPHSADNYERLVVVLAFVAVRILQLRELERAHADASCERVLTRLEWRCLWASTQKTPSPKEPPSALWAVNAIAKLGGWIPNNRTQRPGWIVLWRGWERFEERLEAVEIVRRLMAEGEM